MIVSDSTTLIVLLDLDRVDLLSNLFEKVYIPQAVFEEINYKKDVRLPKLFKLEKVKNIEKLDELKQLLDIGESEAIVLALEKNMPLIIDEKKGRKIAKNLGVKIIGLLGIVLLNQKQGFISKKEAKEFLDNVIARGFRISKKLIEEFVKTLD